MLNDNVEEVEIVDRHDWRPAESDSEDEYTDTEPGNSVEPEHMLKRRH